MSPGWRIVSDLQISHVGLILGSFSRTLFMKGSNLMEGGSNLSMFGLLSFITITMKCQLMETTLKVFSLVCLVL